MSTDPRPDCFAFCLHFGMGAIFGGGVGFVVWAQTRQAESSTAGFWYIGLGFLIFGLLAGFIGDEFWHKLGEFIRSFWRL